MRIVAKPEGHADEGHQQKRTQAGHIVLLIHQSRVRSWVHESPLQCTLPASVRITAWRKITAFIRTFFLVWEKKWDFHPLVSCICPWGPTEEVCASSPGTPSEVCDDIDHSLGTRHPQLLYPSGPSRSRVTGFGGGWARHGCWLLVWWVPCKQPVGIAATACPFPFAFRRTGRRQ